MRVAIDARKLTGIHSGIGIYTLTLVRNLLEQDADLEILLIRHGRAGGPRLAAPRVQEVPVGFAPDSPLTPLLLGRILRRHRFDLFHSPFDLTPRGLREPLVVTVHDLNWIVDPRYASANPLLRVLGGAYYRSVLSASMDRAARIIAVSNATREAILAFAPRHEAKIRVVPNGVETARVAPLTAEAAARLLEPVLGAGGAGPFVLAVGQGLPYKNHLNAVKGFLEAFRDRPEYRLVLVRRSADRDERVRRLLATPEARARVTVLPHVAPEVLNALYRRARALLHPSTDEGFGLPLIEAMAAGLPIVTSNVSSMPEVAGEAALLVDPRDPAAIAAALRRLEGEPRLRERLIEAGRRRLPRFEPGGFARATLAVYREAAAEKG